MTRYFFTSLYRLTAATVLALTMATPLANAIALIEPTFCAVYTPQAAQTYVGGLGSCYYPVGLISVPGFLHTWYVPETLVSVFESETMSAFNGWPVAQSQISHTPLVAAAVNGVFGTADGETAMFAPTLHADASGGQGHHLQAHVGPVYFSSEAAQFVSPWNTSAAPVRGAEACILYSTRMDSYEWKTGYLDSTPANLTWDTLAAISAAGSAAGYATASALLGYQCSQTTSSTQTITFQSSTPVGGATCTANPTQYQTVTKQDGYNCADDREYYVISYKGGNFGTWDLRVRYISSIFDTSETYWNATDVSAPGDTGCYVAVSSYPSDWPNGVYASSSQIHYLHSTTTVITKNDYASYSRWTSIHNGSTCYSHSDANGTYVDLGTGCTPNMVETQVALPTTYTCTETITTPVTTTWNSSVNGPGCKPIYGAPPAAAVTGAGLPAILCAAFGIPVTPPNVVPLHEVSPYDPSINVYMASPIAIGGPTCGASTNTMPTVTLTQNCYDTHFMFPRRADTRDGDRNTAAAVTALKALDLASSTAATVNAIPGSFICTAWTGVCFPWGTPTQVLGPAGYIPDADGTTTWAWVVWTPREQCLPLPVVSELITDPEIATFCATTQPALMSAEYARESPVLSMP